LRLFQLKDYRWLKCPTKLKLKCRNSNIETQVKWKTRQHVSSKSQHTNYLNEGEADEVSNGELRWTMIRMINKIKVDMYKHLN
jgi:hypothetical protein